MEQQTHKRRVRYKGTHPRTYQEKYKELNPEKYKDTIEHVIQKGNTPAGMHLSICVKEILDFLQIRPGQTGLDATLGYGGHSTEMLKCLEGRGHLYALDVDPIEIEKTQKAVSRAWICRNDILSIKQMNFANVKELLPESGKFDFVLADLGVSSMQIDNPERGFSYKFDGPLDLRLDPQKGVPASERLREMSRDEIAGMLIENADRALCRGDRKSNFHTAEKEADQDNDGFTGSHRKSTVFSAKSRAERSSEEVIPAVFSGTSD